MQLVGRLILLLLPALRPSAGAIVRAFEDASGLQGTQAGVRDAASGLGKVGGATDKGAFKALPSSSAAPKDKFLERPPPHRSADPKSPTFVPLTRGQPALNPAPSRAKAFLSNLLKMLQRRLGLGPKKVWTMDDLPDLPRDTDFWWSPKKPIGVRGYLEAQIRQWVISSSDYRILTHLEPYKLEEIPFLKRMADKYDDIEYRDYSKRKEKDFIAEVNNAVKEMLKLKMNEPKHQAVFTESLAILAYITKPAKKQPTQAETIARRTLRNLYPELDNHLEAVHAEAIQPLFAVIKNFDSIPSK